MESLGVKLQRDIDARGIEVIRRTVPIEDRDGMFVCGCGIRPLIIVDPSVSDWRQYNAVRAHELMHYDRRDGNLLAMPPALAEWYEAQVNRDTLLYCVSLSRLANAYDEGCREPWEFAEKLEIPDELFIEAIEYFTNRYGTDEVECGKWILTFTPLRIRRRR